MITDFTAILTPISRASLDIKNLDDYASQNDLPDSKKIELYYYSFPLSFSCDTKARLIYQLLEYANTEENRHTHAQLTTWLLTLINIALPQIITQVSGKGTSINLVAKQFDDNQLQYLRYGGNLQALLKDYNKSTIVNSRSITTSLPIYDEVKMKLPVTQAPNLNEFSSITFSRQKDAFADYDMAICAVSILLLMLGENPDQRNWCLRLKTYPSDVRRKFGKKSVVNTDEPYFPNNYACKKVHSIFSYYPELKMRLGEACADMLMKPIYTPTESVANTTLQHLEMAQMSHVNYIRRVIVGYRKHLLKIESLSEELNRFVIEYKQFIAIDDVKKRNFVKVIYGDRFKILETEDYPLLLNLTKKVLDNSLVFQMFNNDPPAYCREYERLCELVKASGSNM
ncbi:hypothetical protein BD560DRAFT_469701 [Blakeslea trispora]|nr:hypothetical protein BD560DRAFT_469701 [Blakeslea trispora]